MPWFEPCANRGYTKFLQNPGLREDRWVVSDNYLQSLLQGYRQAYVNANGPDYEDSDDILLDVLAANCVGNTSGAATLGAQQAAADRAAGQDYHPQSLSPGGSIPVTAPMGALPLAGSTEANSTVYATGTTNPVGQPGENPTVMPTFGGIGGPADAAGSFPGGGGGGGLMSGPGLFGIPWLLIAAAVGAYFLLKKK